MTYGVSSGTLSLYSLTHPAIQTYILLEFVFLKMVHFIEQCVKSVYTLAVQTALQKTLEKWLLLSGNMKSENV